MRALRRSKPRSRRLCRHGLGERLRVRQSGWRWCSKCQGPWMGSNSSSRCPATGHPAAGTTYPYWEWELCVATRLTLAPVSLLARLRALPCSLTRAQRRHRYSSGFQRRGRRAVELGHHRLGNAGAAGCGPFSRLWHLSVRSRLHRSFRRWFDPGDWIDHKRNPARGIAHDLPCSSGVSERERICTTNQFPRMPKRPRHLG